MHLQNNTIDYSIFILGEWGGWLVGVPSICTSFIQGENVEIKIILYLTIIGVLSNENEKQ